MIECDQAAGRSWKLRFRTTGVRGDPYEWCGLLEDLGDNECEVGLTMSAPPLAFLPELWETVRSLGFTHLWITRYKNGKPVRRRYTTPPAPND